MCINDLGSQIISRHKTLAKISGTRPEEQESYDNAILLMITSTSCLLVFSLLEMGFYFLFNSKVSKFHIFLDVDIFLYLMFKFHPWRGLVKEDQEAFTENLNNLKGIQRVEEPEEDPEDSCCSCSWFSDMSLTKKVIGILATIAIVISCSIGLAFTIGWFYFNIFSREATLGLVLSVCPSVCPSTYFSIKSCQESP